MTDNDWDNGYAKSLGVLLDGEAITTADAYGGRVIDDSYLVLLNASELDLPWEMPAALWSRPWVVELDSAGALEAGNRARRRRHRHDRATLARRARARPATDRREPRMMDVDALRGRANELGVEWSYWDNEGRYHESDMEAVRRVVEVLEADAAAAGPRNLAPVIVGSPASIPIGDGVDQVHLTLADGTDARAGGVRRRR